MQIDIKLIVEIVAILGAFYSLYKIFHKVDKVVKLQPIMMSSVFACLDGLTQLGANGKVTEAKENLLKTLINE